MGWVGWRWDVIEMKKFLHVWFKEGFLQENIPCRCVLRKPLVIAHFDLRSLHFLPSRPRGPLPSLLFGRFFMRSGRGVNLSDHITKNLHYSQQKMPITRTRIAPPLPSPLSEPRDKPRVDGGPGHAPFQGVGGKQEIARNLIFGIHNSRSQRTVDSQVLHHPGGQANRNSVAEDGKVLTG